MGEEVSPNSEKNLKIQNFENVNLVDKIYRPTKNTLYNIIGLLIFYFIKCLKVRYLRRGWSKTMKKMHYVINQCMNLNIGSP